VVIIALPVVVALVFVLFVGRLLRLWLQARVSGSNVKFAELIGMWLRRVNMRTIVICRITAVQAGLQVSTGELESHYLAGGHVPDVVRAVIAASRAGIPLSFKDAASADLKGHDILKEIQLQIQSVDEGRAENARPVWR
jgi:uncharacterized protein YqfA (UPF0365 family)